MANEQHNSEQKSSNTLESSKQKTDQAGAVESAFKLRDLSRLIFRVDAAQELDAWSATAVQFDTYVQHFAKVQNVDRNKWTPFERLDFLNSLWDYCQKNHYHFPFTIRPAQPLVDGDEDDSVSKKA